MIELQKSLLFLHTIRSSGLLEQISQFLGYSAVAWLLIFASSSCSANVLIHPDGNKCRKHHFWEKKINKLLINFFQGAQRIKDESWKNKKKLIQISYTAVCTARTYMFVYRNTVIQERFNQHPNTTNLMALI